jgi:hypothetical protein
MSVVPHFMLLRQIYQSALVFWHGKSVPDKTFQSRCPARRMRCGTGATHLMVRNTAALPETRFD